MNENLVKLRADFPIKGNKPRVISVVIPVKDEEASLPILVESILSVSCSNSLGITDIILVDDGSTDRTWQEMEKLAKQHGEVRALRLRRNFGKATALMAGIDVAVGEIIITMDGDLQDDPEELPRILDMMAAGNDLVSGWKKERNDPLSKTVPSAVFNRITRWVSGVQLHDFNCGYKAYRREIFNTVQLYGELHRYVPVLAYALGYRIAEITVRHHPRRFGRSKYGIQRYLRGFLDLLTVMMITRFAYRPSHLFGGIGILLIAIGSLFLTYLIGLKLFTGADVGNRPLLLLSAIIDVIGVQLLLFGMLAELIISRSSAPARLQDLISQEAGHYLA